MKRKVLLLVTGLILAVSLFPGCTANPIVGKWKDSNSGTTIEFRVDGRVIWDVSYQSVFGSYELKGDELIIDFEGINIAREHEFGGTTWDYNIDDDTLTMENKTRSYRFKKVEE